MRDELKLPVALLAVFFAMAAVQACNCGANGVGEDEDGGWSQDGSGGGGGGTGGAGGGGGSGGGGGGDPEDGGFSKDAACTGTSSRATLGKQPVDIIFVIDNSCSMTSEIDSVQNNINVNFANIIADAGLDYRVIMLSTHGTLSSESICVSAPLSGNPTCNPPPTRPVNTSRFFHYSVEIGSTNSFNQIINTYNRACTATSCSLDSRDAGWSQWLRPQAFKTFVEITDDNNTSTPYNTYTAFDSALLALTPRMFGDANARNYIFHTIAGLGENTPATDPWPPTAAIVTPKCTANGGDSVNNSVEYQRLSILTGGLRFPICMYTSFDAVFQRVAEGVITGVTVACDFTIPTAPDGGAVDRDRLLVEYTPGDGGSPRLFSKTDQGTCGSGRYYLSTDSVHLCPDTCTDIRQDPTAKIDVLFQCLAGCRSQGESCTTTLDCCGGNACLSPGGQPCSGEAGCTCQPIIN